MIRRSIAAAACGAVAVVGLGVAPAAAVPVPALYKLAYSDGLFTATVDGDVTDVQDVTFEQWQEWGFPGYQVLSTTYYSSRFAPELYAVSDFPGTTYDRFPDAITYEEWASTGFAAPVPGDAVITQYITYTTGPEIFAALPEGPLHKLSFAQWASVGYPQPELQDAGFVKLSWDDHIALVTGGPAPEAAVLTAEDWALLGYPTPQVSPRLAGDRFYFAEQGTPVVSYDGPTYRGPVTFAQWQAAGFPTPEPFVPVPTTAPLVVTSPVDGASTGTRAPEFSGTGEPGSDVFITYYDSVDDVDLTAAEAVVGLDGTWSVVGDFSGLTGDAASVTVTQVTPGEDDQVVTLELDLAVVAPVLAFTSLAEDDVDVARQTTITGTGTPGASVWLTVGNHPNDEHPSDLGTVVVDEDGTWSADVTISDDEQQVEWITAYISDAGAGPSSVQVQVTLQAVARPFAVTSPAPGETVWGGSVVVTGDGTAGETVTVTYVPDGAVDEVPFGSVDVDELGRWAVVGVIEASDLVTVTVTQSDELASHTSFDLVVGQV